jgi:hypothetical protein
LEEEHSMPRDNSRRGNSSRSSRNESWSDSVMDVARERPIAAAAAAAGAAAAGLFLWSKRNQISQQLSNLSDQISDWTESMSNGQWGAGDDTGGLTTNRGSSNCGSRSTTSSRNNRGMSETGGGNASLGAHSGGMGTTTTGSPSGRGRAKDQPTT